MDVLFAELVIGDEVVRIPFVCRRCGRCCEELSKVVFDPINKTLYIENFEEIAEHVNLDEILQRVLRDIDPDVKHPIKVKCPFFRDNICEIHPFRPRSCRLFPLLTGDLGVDCPGLKRLKEILEAIPHDKVEYKISDGSLDRVEVSEEIFEMFKRINPTDEELEMFLMLNKVRRKA